MHYSIPLSVNVQLNDDRGHLVFRILFDGNEVGKAEIELSE